MKDKILFICGYSGSGKSFICDKLKEKEYELVRHLKITR